jgi:peroxiredoxin Q/BCP
MEDALVGTKAPDFTLPGTDGLVHLADLAGRVVVLYFYPRDNTPGCTTEACDFRDAYADFNDAGVVVLGVSTDTLQSHQKFRAKHQLPFPLLADEDASVAKQYGVYKQKKLYGKVSWGIERSTFVIDSDGIIRKVYRKVRVPGHVEDVRAQVQQVRL